MRNCCVISRALWTKPKMFRWFRRSFPAALSIDPGVTTRQLPKTVTTGGLRGSSHPGCIQGVPLTAG
jgi:hypothetical protein